MSNYPVNWNWNCNGIPGSKNIGEQVPDRLVKQTLGYHFSGGKVVLVDREFFVGKSVMENGHQDGYQKVVVDDFGIVKYDFGSVPTLSSKTRPYHESDDSLKLEYCITRCNPMFIKEETIDMILDRFGVEGRHDVFRYESPFCPTMRRFAIINQGLWVMEGVALLLKVLPDTASEIIIESMRQFDVPPVLTLLFM